jgi:undecaprenyl-diphosphatase
MVGTRRLATLLLAGSLLLGLPGGVFTVATVRCAETAGTPARDASMTLAQAAVLGIVEGLTEYLPVSSTGHLLLAQRAMGIGGAASTAREAQREAKTAADAYAICIQFGAILAVLGLYTRRVRQMTRGVLGRDPQGLRMATNVLAGFLPAAIIGALLDDVLKGYLFGMWPVVAAWLAGGVGILAVSSWRNPQAVSFQRALGLERMTWRMGLAVGLAQCVAMWPGVSRSLATIVGGLLVGLSLPAAVEFSFLLGMVTLSAATLHDALKHGATMLHLYSFPSLAAGLLAAFIAAVLSIKWMITYLNRHGLAIFGYYRVALAVTVALLIFAGKL